MDVSSMLDLLSAGLSHDVTKWTIAFCIAAWIHSGRVKKEIKTQFGTIVESINSLGTALRNDLNSQNKKIDDLAGRVDQLEKPKTQELVI